MIEVGQKASFSKTIAECDVYGFAGLTGDFNNAHVDEVSAKNGMFGQRIAHGMLVGAYISTVLGMYLPGPGTIYLEQNLKFLKPVFFGDTIRAEVEVSEMVNVEKGIYRLNTIVINQKNEKVVDGYAVVKYRG